MSTPFHSSQGNQPKVTFCTIVLNGEPFTRYHFRSLYPHAHEIIIVEGACPNARGNDRGDGHSRDGTLETLLTLQRDEDPEGKLQIVTAEDEGFPDGFWPGEKDQMMEAAIKRVSGNWVWMVDSDEFYLPETLVWIIQNVLADGKYDTITFPIREFWGSLNSYCNGWRFRQMRHDCIHRLFRWEPGYRHVTHRPPTVIDENGTNLRHKKWLKAKALRSMGHYLFHYGYLFPYQVKNKCRYYSRMDWGYEHMSEWAENHYMRLNKPFRVDSNYTYPSWLEPYNGPHPPQVLKMWDAVVSGVYGPKIVPRKTEDIQKLLRSRRYRCTRSILKHTPGLFVRGMQRAVQLLQNIVSKRMRNRIRKLATPSDLR